MQITIFSLFMSVIWSSVLVAFNYFCRKKHFFIRQLGVTNLLFLYLFSIVRMIVPYKFSFTRVIPSQGALDDLYKSAYVNKMGTTQISFVSVLAAVWIIVSAVLFIRFVFQYRKAMAEFSTYRIREDEQCRRVFNRVLNQSRCEMRICIRQSKYVNIPMGVGIFRRSIILPEETYSDAELYYILRHEYTHFQNRDLVIKSLIHIYGCIFWWNPAIYLLKRDLAQILEIKCDLDVTDKMEYQDKAGYLTAIVTMLKNAEAKKTPRPFYGATALVARNRESEIIERFKIVSASYGSKRRNLLFTGSWFLVFGMLIVLSYSFVLQPDYEMAGNGRAVGEAVSETTTGSPYSIECIDGRYHVYFR